MTNVVRVGTETFESYESGAGDWTGRSVAHTITSGTTLLVASITIHAADTDGVTGADWDPPTANEALTLVDQTTSSGSAGDCTTYTFALVNPTAKAANLRFNSTGAGVSRHGIAITNYRNTITTSVANAISLLDETVNNSATTTGVITDQSASGGSMMYVASGWHGTGNNTVTAGAPWDKVGQSVQPSGTVNVLIAIFEQEATDGITVTSNAANENASHMLQINASGAVYINDAATLDDGEVLQDSPTAANWSDTSITMPAIPDDTGLTGQLYAIVKNADGAVASRAFDVQSGPTITIPTGPVR